MLECVIMNEESKVDSDQITVHVARKLKSIGDTLNLKYADNELNPMLNDAVAQNGLTVFGIVCIASCATALLLYIRST